MKKNIIFTEELPRKLLIKNKVMIISKEDFIKFFNGRNIVSKEEICKYFNAIFNATIE